MAWTDDVFTVLERSVDVQVSWGMEQIADPPPMGIDATWGAGKVSISVS